MVQTTNQQMKLNPDDYRDRAIGDAMDTIIRYRAVYRQKLIDSGVAEDKADEIAGQLESAYWSGFLDASGPGRNIIR
jgi:hypothetical protein